MITRPLPSGGMLIDGPGIRELGIWASPEALALSFSDVFALAETCAQRACRYGAETGCSVQRAIHESRLAEHRLEDYRALQAEIARDGRPANRRGPPSRRSGHGN